MENKKTCFTEVSYVLGIIILAFGTALMEKADLGMSMVVAPAYLLYRAINPRLSFFTFGMAGYVFQAVLLAVLWIVIRKVKGSHLFSFVTAVIYGFVIDGMMLIFQNVPCDTLLLRIAFYVVGMVISSLGVAFLYHTYIAPEVYELFVKEVSIKFNFKIHRTKTVYDICSCLVGIIFSFIFFGFGNFVGVKWGTVVCALLNGLMIGAFGKLLEKLFVFKDALRLRPLFNK